MIFGFGDWAVRSRWNTQRSNALNISLKTLVKSFNLSGPQFLLWNGNFIMFMLFFIFRDKVGYIFESIFANYTILQHYYCLGRVHFWFDNGQKQGMSTYRIKIHILHLQKNIKYLSDFAEKMFSSAREVTFDLVPHVGFGTRNPEVDQGRFARLACSGTTGLFLPHFGAYLPATRQILSYQLSPLSTDMGQTFLKQTDTEFI